MSVDNWCATVSICFHSLTTIPSSRNAAIFFQPRFPSSVKDVSQQGTHTSTVPRYLKTFLSVDTVHFHWLFVCISLRVAWHFGCASTRDYVLRDNPKWRPKESVRFLVRYNQTKRSIVLREDDVSFHRVRYICCSLEENASSCRLLCYYFFFLRMASLCDSFVNPTTSS